MADIMMLQSAFYMAGACSVLIASIYYVLTLRTNQHNTKHTLETRQAQLLMGLFQVFWNRESSKSLTTVFTQQWKEPDEFWNHLREDSDLYADYSFTLRYFDSIGYLVKSGFLQPEQVYDILDGGRPFILMWRKYGELIKTRRKTEGPIYAVNLEYLYNEMVNLRKKQGVTLEAHHIRENAVEVPA